ncbi:MAG: RNA methyltransferase [Phycisphaeraceae bacterium]|nr:RNA methyltransferase [Phycisphaeraceae bacterium]
MPMIAVETLDDPRLDVYRNLKDRDVARHGDRFIAEGEHLVRRLLASDHRVDSVFIAQRRVEELASLVPSSVPLYVAPDSVLEGVIGFAFHSGVLACGIRPVEHRLDDVLPPPAGPAVPLTLVICPEIINADNLGSLIRISAAMGADAMIVGERSCDPYWRRSVRVSMGSIFTLPIVRSDDLLRDLYRLRQEWDVNLLASVLDDRAAPLESIRHPRTPNRVGILLGSESQGLHTRWLTACDQLVTIPMHRGTDSLNVAVAAAVFLYHITRVAGNATGGAEKLSEK